MKVKEYLDRLTTEVNDVKVTQARQQVVLEAQHATLVEHIRRTELLETDVRPLKVHAAVWGALGKVLAAIGVVVAILKAVGVI